MKKQNMYRAAVPFAFGFALFTLLMLAAAPAARAEWGTLKGRFTVDGAVPAPAALRVDKDQEVCVPGGKQLFSQDLVVDPETKGLANVVVFLTPAAGKKPAVHPDYKPGETVEMINAGCMFAPRVTLLWTQNTLRLKNNDSAGHNMKGNCLANRPFNLTVPANGHIDVATLKKEERLPVEVTCSIHTWMKGWLVVRDNPYMAVTGPDGSFEIANLPEGEWEFTFWHEKSGYVGHEVPVTVDGKKQTWTRGRNKIKIAPSGVDLGEVKVPATSFKK